MADPVDQLEKAGAGIAMMAAERLRQVAVEGYTPEHDAEHVDDELAEAAIAYVLAAIGEPGWREFWPWRPSSFKTSSTPLDRLVKAGALIAAEIDRRVASEARSA